MANTPHVYVEWRGGTCRVKWWTGEYHENGRKRYESKGGFSDEDAALQHGQDKLYEIRHGINVTNRDGSTPMTQWLDTWIDSISVDHLTLVSYKSLIENHVRPFFKRQTVAEVDVMMYRAFSKKVRSVLKERSADNVLMVFGMVMGDAVKAELRKTSPVESKSRRGKYTRRAKEKKRPMAIEAVDQLARNAESLLGLPGSALIWTMAMTGMRPAELYGLRREYCWPSWPATDPDRERREESEERYRGEEVMPAIRVQHQVQYVNSALTLLPPKYQSYRTLVIPEFLSTMLSRLLASHQSEWVFPAIEGGSMGAVNFDYRYWRPVADGADARSGPRVVKPRAALPAVPSYADRRLYLLRHGHKEWNDEDGHSRVAVEARQGHELPGVEGVYSNVTPLMEKRIMESLQARWVGLQKAHWEAAHKIDSQLFPTDH
ncbi:integrase [Streptomyces goshikiensis]|uniref:integrase n=1 Tax=Streptomyces goshikiensis TaxID=1942 RepID=UPI002E13689E|nr:integrase [Streptomyces goshikiensis]